METYNADNDKKKIIEAIIFSSPKPVALDRLKEVLEENDADFIRATVEELKQDYERTNRSFTINEVAGGFQMCTHPELSPWIKKFYTKVRTEKLSRPSLETLAIIAYKQPITRAEIEIIRGVNVDGVVKTLLERRLIRLRGRKETPGRPIIYGTTNEFLEYFGLNSLEELPQLKEVEPEGSHAGAAGAGENFASALSPEKTGEEYADTKTTHDDRPDRPEADNALE